MFRTALKPRWLGLLVLVIAVIVTFVWLGSWQYRIAQDDGRAEALAAAAALPRIPLDEAITPHAAFPADASTRKITAVGHYAADRQFLVADRRLDGRPGYWVMTPLVADSTGASLAVLRGFVTDPAAAPPPPTGTVTIEGALAPGEAPSTGTDLPEGQLTSVDLARLVNEWDTKIYNAFLFATAESTDGAAVTIPPTMERVPPPTLEGSPLQWRNAAYALQWWLFAGFAAWMWWKMVREDHRKELSAASAAEGETT